MTSCNQLPQPRYMLAEGGEEKRIDWTRLWCPLGGAISLEGLREGGDQMRSGFLASPSGPQNQKCRPLIELFDEVRALVLCGPPGSGKSVELFRLAENLSSETCLLAWGANAIASDAALREASVGHPLWRKAQAEGRQIVLIFDGFDQIRLPSGTALANLTRILSGHDLGRVRLIVGCRTADWSDEDGAQLLGLWEQSKLTSVFEICPLQRSDVLEAAKTCGIEQPTNFLECVATKRAEVHAGWPITLEPLLHSYATEGDLPSSVQRLYDVSVSKLLERSGHGAPPIKLSEPGARQIARRIAALQIFRQTQSIEKKRWNVAAPAVLTLRQILGEEADQLESPRNGGSTVEVDRLSVEEVLSRAIFTAHGPQNLGFVHHVYAEFLAAEYVKNLSTVALKQLFTVRVFGGELVPPQLAETAAWVAAMNENWYQCLLDIMPEVLLRIDGAQLSNIQKQRLMVRLVDRVSSEETLAFREVHWLTNSFIFDGLAAIVSSVILDSRKHHFARRFACNVVERCQLTEAMPALWEVLERGESDVDPRRWAGRALQVLLPHSQSLDPLTEDRLMRLVRSEMGPDDDDQLKGIALSVLVPKVRSVEQIAAWLTPRRDSNFFGAYQGFLLFGLIPDLDAPSRAGDIAVLLERVRVNRWFSVHSDFSSLTKEVLRRAVLNVTSSRVRNELRALLQECLNSRLPLAVDEEPWAFAEIRKRGLSLEERCVLLSIVLNECEIPDGDVWFAKHALGLEDAPLRLLLDGLSSSPVERRGLWVKTIKPQIWDVEARVANLDKLLWLYENISELRSFLEPCRQGLNIHESLLMDAREREEARIAQFEKAKKAIPSAEVVPTRREHMDVLLGRLRSGDHMVWQTISQVLFMPEDGVGHYTLGDHIEESEGWNSLAPDEHAELRGAARSFLMSSVDPFDDVETWQSTYESLAAISAIYLLASTLSNDLQLCESVAKKWSRAFLLHSRGVSEKDKSVAFAICKLHPEKVRHALLAALSQDNEKDGNAYLLRFLEGAWDKSLTRSVLEFLVRSIVRPRMYRCICKFLQKQDLPELTLHLEGWLRAVQAETDQFEKPIERAKLYCAAFATEGRLWPMAQQHFAPLDRCKNLLLENAEEFYWAESKEGEVHPLLRGLDYRALRTLCFWFSVLFPGDPYGGTSDVGGYYTAMIEMRRFVEAAYALVEPSGKGFDEVKRQLPVQARVSLSFTRGVATKWHAETSWKPMTSTEIIKLVRLSDARLIRGEEDLLDFCVEQITRFELNSMELQGDYFWNSDGTERPETTLSKALTRWLRDRRNLIANCEAQSVTISEDRTDIVVELPNLKPVIIEVKKAHNPNVQTDIQTQLVDRYLLQHQTSFGLYVVGWYGNKASCLGGETLKQDEKNLQKLVKKLTGPAELQVRAMVLDCRRKASSPKRKAGRKTASKRGNSKRTAPKV